MSDAVQINLDDAGHLVDPPIVDLLYLEPETNSFVITFVPEDAVSANRTEGVEIAVDSDEGKRIDLWLTELGKLLRLPGPVTKLFHSGAGDFGFYGPEQSEARLSSPSLSSAVSQQAYGALQDIAQTAQIAFLITKNPPASTSTLKLRPISVRLRNGDVVRGTAEGNNVSWLCVCGYRLPLIGTTRPGSGDTRCPNCGRIYRVFPFPHRGASVEAVLEIEPAQLIA